MMMRINDGRKLNREAQAQIRITAVQRVLDGESPEEVVKSIGFNRRIIYHWLTLYRFGGFEALQVHKSNGRPPKLNAGQMMRLYNIIKDETPRQYTFPFALWTIEMIREVIRGLFKVSMSGVSVWRTLRALGLSAQRPRHVAYQQNEEAVEEFLSKEYPEIQKEAEKRGATVYWGDESAIRSDYHSGTTRAPKGQTPVIKTSEARFSINMLSAISGKGHMRFMVTKKNGTIPVFIDFLKRLVFKQEKPVYLIVDGHPVHKSKKVKEYVESTKGKLKLFYLPGYSPELNPDESVWSYVKHHVIGKKVITGPEQFLKVVKEALYSLMHKPTIISAFFRKPSLQYIL
jgi:transposase